MDSSAGPLYQLPCHLQQLQPVAAPHLQGRVARSSYCMSKKSLPVLYSDLQYKMGLDNLDMQYISLLGGTKNISIVRLEL